MKYNDGTTFMGTMKNGRPHGWGTMTHVNGKGFRGLFAIGRPWRIEVGAYVIWVGTFLRSNTEDESYSSSEEEEA